LVVLASVLALASAAEPGGKSAAVDKVVDLLEELTKKVKAEGLEEAKTYEEFACFCKDNIKEKQTSIQSGKDNKAKLSTAITDDSAKRDGLDDDIKELVDKIDKKEKAIAKLKKENKEAVEEYEVNAADLNNAIKGLKGAIGVMKVNKGATPSFAQMPQEVMETIKTAAVMADALGLSSGSAATALLQGPSLVAASSSVKKIEPYSFDGNDIIKTLETLQTDFKKEKSTLDKTEKTRKDKFDKDLAAAEDFVDKKNTALEGKKDDKAKTTAQIATESKDLSGISAQLLDDMDYLKELAQICGDKAKTWDVRNKVRADELTALAAATGIVKGTVADKTSKGTVRLIQQKFSATRAEFMVRDEDAMEQAEADAEQQEDSGSFALGFLQKRSSPHFALDGVGMADRELQHDLDHPESVAVQRHGSGAKDAPADGRQAVMMLLKKAGVTLHSSILTSLASKIAADPFIKIKKLIQELIERLLTEAANESSQKGWCDKSIADAEQKRDMTAEKLEALNTEMAKQESRRDTLVEELSALSTEIKDLTKAQKDADDERKKEKAENKVTVTEAKAGLDAVRQAIDILDKFYKTAAKSKVLAQVGGPKDDMPDAGFKNGEAYKGAQGGAGGVVGMLEVIESDFVRTVKETEKAEGQAEDDHLKFTTETQMSLAAKKQATKIKTEQKDDAKQKLSDAQDGMNDKTKLMETTIKELLDLQPACVDTGMSYQERVEAREDEIKALKKALCIFEAYQKYGADGAGAQC